MTNIADWYPVLYAYEPETEQELDELAMEEFKREREGNWLDWEDDFEAEYGRRIAESNEVPMYIPTQENRTTAGARMSIDPTYNGPKFGWLNGK